MSQTAVDFAKEARRRVVNYTASSNQQKADLAKMATKAMFVMEDRMAVAQVERAKIIGASQSDAEKHLIEAMRHEHIADGMARAILMMTES